MTNLSIKMAMYEALKAGSDKVYDETFQMWIKNGVAEPTLIVSSKYTVDDLKIIAMSLLSKVNPQHIIEDKYVEDEKDRVREAAKVLLSCPIYFEHLSDITVGKLNKLINKYNAHCLCADSNVYGIADRKFLEVTDEDLEGLDCILRNNPFEKPVCKALTTVKKGNRSTTMYVWYSETSPMFATCINYNLIQINDVKLVAEEL